MTPYKHQAIRATLEGNWELAITINEELLKDNPTDIETLNRLAFAYIVVGKTTHAKNAYKKVLEIDVFNPIAIRNLKRLGINASLSNHPAPQIMTNMFLEESGKTKIISLINTAPSTVLQILQGGQMLKFCIKRFKIFVLDENDQYIGMLPDSLGARLIKFIKGGNTYEVYIKSAENHNISIFIREKERSVKFKNQPSFSSGEKTTLLLKKDKMQKNKSHQLRKSPEDEDA